MSKIIFVDSPSSTFRPEMWIMKMLKEGARSLGIPHLTVEADKAVKLDNQKLFYDNTTMTKSFFNGVLGALDVVEDGDVIFFGDAWNPAIPALKFHLYCSGLHDVKMCGIFHSSVETPGDFLYEAGKWVRNLEHDLVDEYLDKIFVATKYGKDNIIWNGGSNISITGLPFISPSTTLSQDSYGQDLNLLHTHKDSVIFSHRWAADKNPFRFIKLVKTYKQNNPNSLLKFKVLHPVPLPLSDIKPALDVGIEFILCSNKIDYWREVGTAKVAFSSATLETWGYSIIDAIIAGALPMVPSNACYPYMYKPFYMYDRHVGIQTIYRHFMDILASYKEGAPQESPFLDGSTAQQELTAYTNGLPSPSIASILYETKGLL